MNKKIIIILLYISLIAGFFYFVMTHDDMVKALSQVSVFWLAMVILVKLLVQVANGYRYYVLLFFEKIYLPFHVWLPLSCVGTLQNVVLPGNTAVMTKGVYLKKKFSLAYKPYFLLTLTGIVLFIMSNAIVIFMMQSYLAAQLQQLLYVLLVFSIVFISVMAWLNVTSAFQDNKFMGYLNAIKHHVLAPVNTPVVIRVILSEWVLIVVRSLAMWTCFAAFAYLPSVVEMVIISIVVTFSSIVNLTPGNIGVTESVIIGLSLLYGIPFEVAVAASVLSRITSIISQVMVAIVYGKNLVDASANI
ncbi:MAG: lysylphosphatidylglycerol synthase domain-containing protein [Methylococcales bacterium]